MEKHNLCINFEGYSIEYHKRTQSINMTESHRHNMLEVFVVYAGSGEALIDGSIYTLQDNMVYIIPSNVNHQIMTNSSLVYDRTVIYFSVEYFQQFFKTYTRGVLSAVYNPENAVAHTVVLTSPERRRIDELIDALIIASNDISIISGLPEIKMLIYILELLSVVGCAYLDRNMQIPPQNNMKQSKITTEICNYIHGHLSEKISLESIADHFHMNRYYLACLFRQTMGISVHKYILDRKVATAKHLLSTTTNSISEIALMLSFFDNAHLSRTFKERIGCSPNEFRQRTNVLLCEPIGYCDV